VETLALTPTVATPTFSPVAGTYTSVQTVAITSATSGASIRYTTNGSTPSETAGTPYSGPVTVSSTETINAIAYETGMSDSVVAAASYTINLPAVSTISSTSGQQGQVLTGVQITGQFTRFAAGSALSFSNTGVTASSITVTDGDGDDCDGRDHGRIQRDGVGLSAAPGQLGAKKTGQDQVNGKPIGALLEVVCCGGKREPDRVGIFTSWSMAHSWHLSPFTAGYLATMTDKLIRWHADLSASKPSLLSQ
jgi:hypothetical protein